MLADGSRATFSATSAPASKLERRIYAGVETVLRDHARAIAEDYPKHWRQSGGYRLDRMDPFDLSKLVVGSEGTLAITTAATVGLVRLPKAKMFVVGHFDSLLGAIAATEDALALRALRGRDDRPHDPRALALPARVPALHRPPRRRPGGAAVRVLLRRRRGRGARQARQADARVGAPRPRLPHAARRDRGRAGRADQGPQGRARPADGLERGPQAPGRVRRGHRGRARAARRVRRALQGDLRAARAAGRLLRPLLGRLPAHPPVPRSLAARRRSRRCARSPRRSSTSSRSSTASTPPSTATGAIRSPVQPADLRRRALRRDAAR